MMRITVKSRQVLRLHSNIQALILLLLIPVALLSQVSVSKNYEKKVAKLLEETLPPGILLEERPGMGDVYHIFYELRLEGKAAGHLVYAAAKGRYDYFDYVVVLDTTPRVLRIDILKYRSDHGYQIASERWLEQFTGYDGSNMYEAGQDVDAVSGATISSASLCHDLYNIFKLLSADQNSE